MCFPKVPGISVSFHLSQLCNPTNFHCTMKCSFMLPEQISSAGCSAVLGLYSLPAVSLPPAGELWWGECLGPVGLWLCYLTLLYDVDFLFSFPRHRLAGAILCSLLQEHFYLLYFHTTCGFWIFLPHFSHCHIFSHLPPTSNLVT